MAVTAAERFCSQLERVDRILDGYTRGPGKALEGITGIGAIFDSRCAEANNIVGSVNGTICFARSITTIKRLVTGTTWWKIDENTGMAQLDEHGNRVLRDPHMIALQVSLAVGRLTAAVGKLHSLGLINLGKHAQGLGMASMVAYTGVQICDTVDTIYDLATKTTQDPAKHKARVMALVSRLAECASMFGENLPMVSPSPLMQLIAAILVALSAILFTISEALQV